MTQSEYIKRFIHKSGDVSEADWNAQGMFAVPCRCIDENCQGWQMVSFDNAIAHLKTYVLLQIKHEQ